MEGISIYVHVHADGRGIIKHGGGFGLTDDDKGKQQTCVHVNVGKIRQRVHMSDWVGGWMLRLKLVS